MIRHFCDFCGREIVEPQTGGQNGGRLAAELRRLDHTLRVEVIHSKDNVSNAGDACKHCILDALQQLDDRPLVVNGLASPDTDPGPHLRRLTALWRFGVAVLPPTAKDFYAWLGVLDAAIEERLTRVFR